jgi:hypothetical protein
MRSMRFALLLLLAVPATPVLAQVGHEPAKSPYYEILYDNNLTAYASYFDGSGGTLGIGVHDSWMYGLRYQLRANRFISFGLGGSYGWDFERNIIDPFADPGERIVGTAKVRVFILEGLLQFNFTANKSWHGIAPYAGIGFGAGFSSSAPQDTIYRSSVRFVFTPYVGTRLFIRPALALRLEARMPLYKLSYPNQYLEGDEPVIGTGGEWVASGWFLAGLSFNFTLSK